MTSSRGNTSNVVSLSRATHGDGPVEPAVETGDSVRSLKVVTIAVPLPEPHQTASGTLVESPLVAVRLNTEQGHTGNGIVFTYTRQALKPTADFLASLEELVQGKPLDPRALDADLRARFRLLGTQGLVGMALAGLDMALWDALFRGRNQSLVRYFNGQYRPIPVYGGVAFEGPEGSARSAEQWARRGVTGVKAKIGYPTVEEDLAVIRAMRSAVGRDVAIMVDYNQSLSVRAALERLKALEDEGLTWVEEPVAANDFAGQATITRAIRTPIQSGENWWGVQEMRTALEAGASDYVMPDVMKIGGVTGWLGALRLAQRHGVRLSSHLWPELSGQLLAITPTAHWLEYVDWWNPVLEEPLVVTDGYADVRGAAGTGVRFNDEAIERYRV